MHVMQHAAGRRVTVQWSDGTRRRVALPLLPPGHLTLRCLAVLREVLPVSAFNGLYSAFIAQSGDCGTFPRPQEDATCELDLRKARADAGRVNAFTQLKHLLFGSWSRFASL